MAHLWWYGMGTQPQQRKNNERAGRGSSENTSKKSFCGSARHVRNDEQTTAVSDIHVEFLHCVM